MISASTYDSPYAFYDFCAGRRLFEELDRDSDGQVTLDDLELAMKKRRLPQRYAREFLRRTRKHWFAKSIGWTEFQLLMEQKEPQMLRAFTSLALSKSGTLQKNQVLASLKNAGLPATDGNAAAMMKFLNVDTEGSVAYGQFRNFMLLLPPERLGDDPRYGLCFQRIVVGFLACNCRRCAYFVLMSLLIDSLIPSW